ncbi:hypothetical protein [Chitinimonas naiadis]
MHFSSTLAASVQQVRAEQLTVAGGNFELSPWLRMRFPSRHWQSLLELPCDVVLGRYWLWLFGCLPVDYDELCFEQIGQDGFVERSSLPSQVVWRHERRIVGKDNTCTLNDSVSFTPRRGVPGWLSRRIIHALFQWRHRRLRERYQVPAHA